MNTQLVGYKVTDFRAGKLILFFPVTLLLPLACTRQPQPAKVEEITFQSGEFMLVGDLRTPAGTGPFPLVIFAHGDGSANRTLFGMYLPIMERMLQAGYAVFSWDKPGSGESSGPTSRNQKPRCRRRLSWTGSRLCRRALTSTHAELACGESAWGGG